jgi:SAM-dependent MidA family methyltransferase
MNDKSKTPLEQKLIEQIRDGGPIGIDQYMSTCLGDAEFGYYMGKDPFGRGGDFITAPEVSQMFGEAIGVWFATAWQMMGSPEEINLVELGPGRGTLMADILRATKVLDGFEKAVKVHMVEMSPALRKLQGETLKGIPVSVHWHQRIEQVPVGKALYVGNEFFDALPIRQMVFTGGQWVYRVVGLSRAGELELQAGSQAVDRFDIPRWARQANEGDIAEISPARMSVAEQIGSRISRQGGAGLFIDYGHERSFTGETFQAVRKHKFVDVLSRPGHSDLTSHVDFEELAEGFRLGGAVAHELRSQQAFLIAMGLRQREAILKKKASARGRIVLSRQADRLVNEKAMGHLFKVLAITDKSLGTPHPFGEPQHD